jgi:hypothetical protein
VIKILRWFQHKYCCTMCFRSIGHSDGSYWKSWSSEIMPSTKINYSHGFGHNFSYEWARDLGPVFFRILGPSSTAWYQKSLFNLKFRAPEIPKCEAVTFSTLHFLIIHNDLKSQWWSIAAAQIIMLVRQIKKSHWPAPPRSSRSRIKT